jgi:hypothetical protein
VRYSARRVSAGVAGFEAKLVDSKGHLTFDSIVYRGMPRLEAAR